MANTTLSFLFRPCKVAIIVGSFLGLVWPVAGGAGQNPQAPVPVPTVPRLPGDVLNAGPGPMANSEKVEHMREEERRKRLLADTARLVELSNELNSDVEKTPKDALSLDVVRKAAEIEKLAHDVKERMKS